MKHRLLEPAGVVVDDFSVADAEAGDIAALKVLLAERGVVVMPAQQADDAAFVGFLERFGALAFSVGETPVDGYPDLNLVSNVGRTTTPRSVFHVDTSYVRRPPAYTALRAVEIPARGGETLFTNQYRAFDTLPADVRAALHGRLVRHVVTGLELDDDDETSADHPIFRPHPISGRTALYLSTPERCVSISGLSTTESTEMIEFLFAHSTSAANTYRHTWTTGDVVMWDNGCVLHRADHSGVVGDRVMHRGMVASYGIDVAGSAA